MFKYRALTWMVLIVFVIWGIFSLPAWGFGTIMTLFLGIAAWEWTNLLKIQKGIARVFILGFFFLLAVVSYLYFPKLILFVGCVGWIIAAYYVIQFPEIISFRSQKDSIKLIMGILLFVPCWVGLNVIRGYDKGVIFILFVFSLIWMMDTLGYLVGKPWGKNKLAPKLSPGKSIEGVVGGLVFTLLLAQMIIYSSSLPLKKGFVSFLLILVVISFSVVGDLFESLLKRQADVKDSGKLLPGHGGILDRLDSTLAAIPFFAFTLPWMLDFS